MLDARRALAEAKEIGAITIRDGTKGGRTRQVPITEVAQLVALGVAASIQDGRSLVPRDQRYIDFARAAYREFTHYHGQRHHYAQRRYEALVGAPCPLVAGVRHGAAHHRYLAERLGMSLAEARQLDHTHRLTIAEELGHGRIEITHAYLG